VNLGTGRTALAVTAGGEHTCAILDTRALRCWGSGSHGRTGHVNTNHVGDDETPGSVPPVDLGTGRTAVAVSAGKYHTCAILDDGSVRCFGFASSGQLGYGNVNDIGDNETPGSAGPVDLGVGRTAVALAAGDEHTCALLDNGDVRCWGHAAFGELGYGNTDPIGDDETPGSVGPVDLGTGRTAVAIAAGAAHTCAVLDDGSVRCWGINGPGSGQLGYGNPDIVGDDETPGSVGPVNLGAGRTAVAIAPGQSQTCALLDTGRVRCWGWSEYGSLGYGNTTSIGDDETPDVAGPVAAGGLVGAPVVGLGITPKRDRTAPFRVGASGKLTGLIVTAATCTGKVEVRAKKGARSVVARPNVRFARGSCSYAASLRVPVRGIWTVTARFMGNGSLLAATSVRRSFRAG
jgi:hypothetical protein